MVHVHAAGVVPAGRSRQLRMVPQAALSKASNVKVIIQGRKLEVSSGGNDASLGGAALKKAVGPGAEVAVHACAWSCMHAVHALSAKLADCVRSRQPCRSVMLQVTDAIRTYVAEKLSHACEHFSKAITKAEVTLSARGGDTGTKGNK